MREFNEHQRQLLSDLVAKGGSATSAELGGYTAQGARARTKSRIEGLVRFDGKGRYAKWLITDAGKEALERGTR